MKNIKKVDINKTSVVDDIDFEIELVRRDNINVAYILELLKQLDVTSPSFKKDKDFIINTMEGSLELKSKVELIEKFIDGTIVPQDNEIDVEAEFDNYMAKEKAKEIKTFIQEENLEPIKVQFIINNYEYSGKIKDTNVEDSINDELGLIQRQEKVKTIKQKIIDLVNKFTW